MPRYDSTNKPLQSLIAVLGHRSDRHETIIVVVWYELIVVHCAHGMNRTGVFMVDYLCRKGVAIEEALKMEADCLDASHLHAEVGGGPSGQPRLT